jgi:O-antigen ligase
MRAISAINLLVGLIVILKTGSRSGLIASVAVFAYLVFVKTNTVKVTFITKTVLVTAAITSLQFIAIDTERYKTILDVQNDYNITDETGRMAIWKTGIKMMLSRPLTGVGMGCFNEGVGRDREKRGLESAKWQTAHNSIIQIGAETGIFGFVLFCLMSLNVFRITGQIIDKSRSEELVKISEMARVGFIGQFISAMFLSQAYSVYWAFYIILSAVLKHMLDKETQTPGIINRA